MYQPSEFESLGQIADRPSLVLVKHGNRYFRMHHKVFASVLLELSENGGDAEASDRKMAAEFLRELSAAKPPAPKVREVASVDVTAIAVLVARVTAPITALSNPIKAVILTVLLAANAFLAAFGWAHPAASGVLAHKALVITAGMFAISILHELCHSAVAMNLGCNVKRIGLGFYRIIPVFFSDVSDIWRLPARDRVSVDAAGIFAQAVIGIALYAISISSAEPMATGVRYLFAANLFVIVLNLLPFARLDGYWIVSDLFDVANLQKDSRAALKDVIGRLRGRWTHASTTRWGLAIYALLNFIFTFALLSAFVYVISNFIYQAFVGGLSRQKLVQMASHPFAWLAAAFIAIRVVGLWRRITASRSSISRGENEPVQQAH